jgi:acetyl-CoA acetyltransferase
VIASAVRTPVGCFNGSLKSLRAIELGGIAAKAAIEKAGKYQRTSFEEQVIESFIQVSSLRMLRKLTLVTLFKPIKDNLLLVKPF